MAVSGRMQPLITPFVSPLAATLRVTVRDHPQRLTGRACALRLQPLCERYHAKASRRAAGVMQALALQWAEARPGAYSPTNTSVTEPLRLRRRGVGFSAMAQVIFETTSGNVIGVVEEPPMFHSRKPLKDQYLVKIGVIDRDRGLPKKDARIVIERLRKFVTNL